MERVDVQYNTKARLPDVAQVGRLVRHDAMSISSHTRLYVYPLRRRWPPPIASTSDPIVQTTILSPGCQGCQNCQRRCQALSGAVRATVI
eukprot:2125223-Prymnesium_polylepis.1